MTRFSAASSLTVLAVLSATAVPLSAEELSPAEQLLQLVHEDVGVCIQATDLNTQTAALLQMDLVTRLHKTSFYQGWMRSNEFQQLKQVQGGIAFLTGQPAEKFTSDIFGHAMVLALYPPTSPTDTDPVGVFLTYTASPEALQNAIAAWNKAEKHQTKTVQHLAYSYQHRISKPGSQQEETVYYATLGNIFALSDDLASIQQVLKLYATQTTEPAASSKHLLNSGVYRKVRREFPDSTLLTAFINPRSWDAALVAGQNHNDPVEKLMFQGWKQTNAVMLGVRQDQGFVADLVVQYNSETLSPAWNRYASRTRGKAEFLRHVPSEAILAIAGRVNLAGVELLMLQETPPTQLSNFRQVSKGLLLGLDLFDDVLPQIGPNWGSYLVPRKDLRLNAIPFEGLFAIELPVAKQPSTDEGKAARLRLGLSSGLNTGFNLLAALTKRQRGEKPTEVKSETTAGSTVRWIDSIQWYQPAFCVAPRHLVFASHPDLIKEFLAASKSDEDDFSNHSAFRGANQAVLFRGDLLRTFLIENKTFFLKQAAELSANSENSTPAEVQLQRLTELASLCEFVYFTAKEEKSQVRFTWGLQTAP